MNPAMSKRFAAFTLRTMHFSVLHSVLTGVRLKPLEHNFVWFLARARNEPSCAFSVSNVFNLERNEHSAKFAF